MREGEKEGERERERERERAEYMYHICLKFVVQTKLANPHYKPEMQAQATLINFTVTRDGLEEQLLAEVVATERPDLEKTKVLKLSDLISHSLNITLLHVG